MAVWYIAFGYKAFSALFWPNPLFIFIAFLCFDSLACVNLDTEIADAANFVCVWCVCVCVCALAGKPPPSWLKLNL